MPEGGIVPVVFPPALAACIWLFAPFFDVMPAVDDGREAERAHVPQEVFQEIPSLAATRAVAIHAIILHRRQLAYVVSGGG
ncbi:MAG: hypothetical protein ISN26_01020 [Betaproteobacteria bacterium AqS2]|uniref:Uncharacterized protein n=1 Tax=Candidatus Amphirhobacter heronislandensis TaxID=1732024 RepID=A0A930UFE7_9GAMM|nr:hypothetical protein [Betaproteobacteria bacterium AqS2]